MSQASVRVYLRLLTPVILGIALVLSAVSGLALAQEGGQLPALLPQSASTPDDSSPPPVYARVVATEAPVYADPRHITEGIPPVRSLGTGYLWVTVDSADPILVDGQTWYAINEDEYVLMDHLSIYTPSTFQGVEITTQPTQPFAWLVYYVQPSITPGIVTTATAWLKRYDMVTISATTQITEGVWYQIGPDRWVYQTNLSLVQPVSRPAAIGPDEKWVEVNLFEQTLVAYEGDRMVYATLISSGLPRWPTIEGLYRLWTKVKAGKMGGGEPGDDYYFLEDVPWTMYFKGAYALHGAYWHDSFGFPHSHGCVNMPLADSKWLFDWGAPTPGQNNWTKPTEEEQGMWVWVHDGTGIQEPELVLNIIRGR